MGYNIKDEKIPFQASTIETVDFALYDYVNDILNVHTDTNAGWIKTPVVWATAERSYISKRRKEERDAGETVSWPIITIEREGFVKDPARKGTAWGNVPHEDDAKGGAAAIMIARQIKQDKTGNFANADAKKFNGQINFPRKKNKVVYETITIPMPVYIVATYKIKIKTDYQQQMNDIQQVFTNKTGGINYFLAKREGHRYEGFMKEDFTHNNNVSQIGQETRKFETEFHIEVLAYLIGTGRNDEQPTIVRRENAVQVKVPRERVIVGDVPEFQDSHGVYVGLAGLGAKKKGGQD